MKKAWRRASHGDISLQHGRDKYGCSRVDKVLYCGEVEVRGLERVGVGIKVGHDLLVTNLASGIPGISAMNTLAPGSLILPSSLNTGVPQAPS
jgi:hypothetical protein